MNYVCLHLIRDIYSHIQAVFVKHKFSGNSHFLKNATLILTDDFELGTTVKVSPQEIHMQSMKALSVNIQKLWPMIKFVHCRRKTD